MLKSFFNSPIGPAVIGWIVAWYSLIVRGLNRWELVGREHLEAVQASQKGVVLCLWHNRLLGLPMGWPRADKRRQQLAMLISRSRFGDISASASKVLHYGIIRGSSAKPGKADKGAVASLREMLRHITKGGAVGLMPDGPRGPRMRAQAGAVQLAMRTGAPILCFAWSQRRRPTLKTWDQQLLPHLFSPGVVVWAEPITVPRNASPAEFEAARLKLETTLTRITDEADRRAGVPPIAAAPIDAPVAAEPA